MAEKLGTKETREVIDFVFGAAVILIREKMKDGLQWTDAIKLMTHEELQRLLVSAAAGISVVDDELSDLSGFEGLDLALYALTRSKELLTEMKGAA